MVPEGGAAGFVVDVPSSPRSLALEAARALTENVPSGAEIWAVTKDPTPEAIHRLFDELGVDRIEVVGTVPAELEFLETHHIVPSLPLPAWDPAAGAPKVPRPEVHPILRFDAPGDPLPSGSATRADWETAHALVEAHPGRKMILAGGLDASNVAEALATVRPWGVDVCAGVERPDGSGKDPDRVRAFLEAVAGAEG